MQRTRYPREFENQALIKVRERGEKSVRAVAQELHMSEGTLRCWRRSNIDHLCRLNFDQGLLPAV